MTSERELRGDGSLQIGGGEGISEKDMREKV